MEEMQIDPFSFFAVLEGAVVFLVVALAFFFRARLLSGRVETLQAALKKAQDVEPPEAVGLDQYLRDELLRNQAMIDTAAASGEDDEKAAADSLAMRSRFLELELAARELEGNPVEFQAKLAGGINELIEQLRPEPETVSEALEQAPDEVDDGESAEDEESRARVDTHEAEFDRLRDVINNQQDAMAALREQLQARESEIEDLDTIMAKLDEFERHDAELQQCLEVLEQENHRLKQAGAEGGEKESIAPMDPAQLTGLQDMLNNQQDTISNLQNLIQELAPEASKAKELEDALSGIQRANQELNSCVAVLEDENAMLRAELESINAQLDAQADTDETPAAVPDQADADADASIDLDDELALVMADDEEEEVTPDGDDEKHQLEIKVQELEALVEFKDAAIEELEKQYSTLESKYLAATGEKKAE